MKKIIVWLLLAMLFGIVVPMSFAPQDQDTPKSNPEIKALKEQISALQNQLQTVESEKLEVIAKLFDAQAKLADSNAKLANAEFGKLERELRDSNEKWLIGWIIFFLTVLAVVGTPLWLLLKSGVNRIITNLKSNADQLISDEVEKSLTGFKEAVEQVNILQDQIRILEKEHAASILEGILHNYDWEDQTYPENVKMLADEALLDLFGDKTRSLIFRYKAGEVLAVRKCPQFVSSALEFLNSVVDLEFDWKNSFFPEQHLKLFVNFLGQIYTQETYEGLTKLLDRLTLIEETELKDLLLTSTTFSLAWVSLKLNIGDSIPMLRSAVSHLQVRQQNLQALKNLARHFDIFNEPEGIKEILTHHAIEGIPDVETKCLALLQKHDPNFVKEWQAQKESANAETEGSS